MNPHKDKMQFREVNEQPPMNQGDVSSVHGEASSTAVIESYSWFQEFDSNLNRSSDTNIAADSSQYLGQGFPDTDQCLRTTITSTDQTRREFPGEPCRGRKRKYVEGDAGKSKNDDVNNSLCGEPRRKKQDPKPKRSGRSAEIHNLYERRRRDRFQEKLKNLRELVPHGHKHDVASTLDNVIEYIKYLNLQIEMLPTGGIAMEQTSPCMSQLAGVPGLQIPASSSPPMIPLPSAAGGQLLPMSAHVSLPVPQLQMPFLDPSPLPAGAVTSTALLASLSASSTSLNSPYKGECSSQSAQSNTNIQLPSTKM